MDFADDFKYFTLELVLDEARQLYRHNRYIKEIRLEKAANDEPTLNFYVDKPRRLGIHQLGLPARFRCMPTRWIVANDL
jgi:hypothetical protein